MVDSVSLRTSMTGNIDCPQPSRVPFEGKSSVCVICMKYRIIILITCIIIISLGQILLSCIANTSRTGRWRPTMTELTPLFAGSAGDQWPVSASFKNTVAWTPQYSLKFWVFYAYKKVDTMYFSQYEQFETSPEMIEQEL